MGSIVIFLTTFVASLKPPTMKLDMIFFNTSKSVNEEISNFANSFSNQKLNLKFTSTLQELQTVYDKKNFNILLLDTTKEYLDVLTFLNETSFTISKIIILAENKQQIFDFLKYDFFDFIVLPLQGSDLICSINRCINRINDEVSFFQLKIAETKYQKFIPINSTKKIELIKLDDIVCFEADGRYTLIYLNNGVSKMASKNLGEFQKLLDPDIFCRIHHKFIINMNNLVNIIKADGFYCEMTNNKNIPVSKRKLEDLNSALNIGKHLL
jgi:two-component system LytT family response regulator